MMRNSKYIAMALGAALLLAGCSGKSPTAPKPTPIPSFNISLTPEATSAKAGESVLVTARVTSGSANAPDGTAVTFDVSGGEFPPTGATEAVRTTTGGSTNISVTSSGGTATILGRVPGGSDETSVTFTGVAPTPTPTGTPVPLDYTPNIYALTPNAGPFEGGTRVTISGTGFQAPVQVLFDDIQAQVVSTSYTEIVCISPSITPTAPDTVITKQVTVTNISNGKVSNSVGFRYGVTMFISSFTPMEGPADTPTTVTIFGQGFVAPVSVVASLGGAWDVLSVAGTEIVVRTKPLADNSHVCSGGSTTFTVTNINSNQSYDSPGSFTYRGVHPLITSVLIGANNLVNQCGGTCAACVTPYTITVRGSGFQTTSTMTVTLDGSAGGSIGPLIANVTDANTLTIGVTDLSIFTMATTACSPPAGGTRNVSTPVDVTVRNVRYDCSDRLNGALVVVPCDLVTCTAPVLYTLTLTPAGTNGTGIVTSSPAGASCPAICTPTFPGGTTVTLTGSPTAPSTFAGWSGTDCTLCGAATTCAVLMSTNRACTATFNGPLLTINRSGATNGARTITSNPAFLGACAGGATSCTGNFGNGASVTLSVDGANTATWGGACTPTGGNPANQATVTMSAAQTCTAVFP